MNINKLKIVFFGTANVALPVLESLFRNHEVVAVVTSPDALVGRKKELTESPVSVLAKEMKVLLLKPESVKETEFVNQLKSFDADIFVVVAYGKILPTQIINLPRYKTLNVHFSLLPKYRGASPIQTAILNGETKTGTSIFVLDEKMDTGPVIAQESIDIDPDDNYITLPLKLAQKSAKLLISVLPGYINGDVKPVIQDDFSATYTKILSKADGKIDFQKTAPEIYNQFRAFFPWPGIWTEFGGKTLKILDCTPTEMQNQNAYSDVKSEHGSNSVETVTYKPGTVLTGGIVVCGKGTFLEIVSLKPEGKNEMKMADFLNGNSGFVGSVLK